MAELLRQGFTEEGFSVTVSRNGTEALGIAQSGTFDVIVLDVMLPGTDGLTLCRAIRDQGRNRDTPILILTARRDEQDKLAGFGHGADDYLTKPFSIKEFSCRVDALTRRVRRAPLDALASAPPIAIKALQLDPARRSVRIRGADVAVTPHEFRLLYRLASNPGEVFTRERLLSEIWQGEAFVTERSIDTLVRRLRMKIESDPAEPDYLLTVWGDGYKCADA